MDLRSHVAHRATVCLKVSGSISASDWCSVSKVSQLQIVIITHQKILRFQISVGYSSCVAVVKAFHKLLEVVSGKLLAEFACLCDDIEEASSMSKLKNDESYFLWRFLAGVLSIDGLS